MDHYIRGSYQDVDLNRALTHWLSCANLPYNLLGGGAFMNWCYKMHPRYRVPSRSYMQCIFFDTGYAAATKMLSVFLSIRCMWTQCGFAQALGSPDMES